MHEVVAGVVDPPGPDEVRRLADLVLRGVVQGDFADTLYRAAAFARVVAAGRAHVGATHAGHVVRLGPVGVPAAHAGRAARARRARSSSPGQLA